LFTREKIAVIVDHSWAVITAKSTLGVALTSLRRLGHPAWALDWVPRILCVFSFFHQWPSPRPSRNIPWSIIYFPHCKCHRCDIWCDICHILWNSTITKTNLSRSIILGQIIAFSINVPHVTWFQGSHLYPGQISPDYLEIWKMRKSVRGKRKMDYWLWNPSLESTSVERNRVIFNICRIEIWVCCKHDTGHITCDCTINTPILETIKKVCKNLIAR